MSSTRHLRLIYVLFAIGVNFPLFGQNDNSDTSRSTEKKFLKNIPKQSSSIQNRLEIPKPNLGIPKRDTANTDSANSVWKRLPKPGFKGRVGIEGYHTTFQNPRVLNEPQYLRVQGNAAITWLGLPLLVDFYRTTESQTFYNSNYFKVQFDYQSYINGIKQNWQKKIEESENSLNTNKIKEQQNKKVEDGIDKQKQELLQHQKKVQNNLDHKAREYEEKYRAQLDSTTNNYKDSLRGELNSRQDSLRTRAENKEQRLRDSTELKRLTRDTQRIANRIRDLQETYQEYQEKKEYLDSTIKADSAKLAHYKQLLQDPEGAAGAWLQEQGFPKQLVFLSRLKEFQTGIVNPYLHSYSISGIGVKGLTTAFGNGRSTLKLTGGKTTISDLNYYQRTNTIYERLVLGGSYTYKLNTNTQWTMFGHYMNDPIEKMSKEGRTAYTNSNYGMHILAFPRKLVNLEASLATSHFQSTNTVIESVIFPAISNISALQNRKARSAYLLLAERSVTGWLTLQGSDQFVGPAFKNLGNPFMRTNFREQQAKAKLVLLKKQLHITGFYKSMRDNPLGWNEITNRTSGYGFSLQTRFKNRKLPNFNGSISPYEQGNNHPDSLFRVNSKYSIITGGITYRINRARFKYFSMVYGSQSIMQFNDSFSAVVRTLTWNQDFAIGKHLTIGSGTTFIRTFPSVDSTQVNIWQGRISYVGTKGSNIMLSSQYSQYLNGAFRKGASLSIAVPIGKKLRLTSRVGFDHYYKLWGMNDQKAWSGLVRLEVKL